MHVLDLLIDLDLVTQYLVHEYCEAQQQVQQPNPPDFGIANQVKYGSMWQRLSAHQTPQQIASPKHAVDAVAAVAAAAAAVAAGTVEAACTAPAFAQELPDASAGNGARYPKQHPLAVLPTFDLGGGGGAGKEEPSGRP